ncbi:MAG TPA: BT_3928 family protein [Flavobacteriaceae bacterium]|nr:BT_3928 family protein [Flavobacteriaceae bacterium]
MKTIVAIARAIVGIIFIFSGFIKLNDPVGFSYKLQEYFGPQVLGLEFLIPYALMIAVFIVIFELMVGVTLLLGYAPKFTRWSLLLMILFFTFLTFYSAYFNKVTDCGCFGDAIPLTPWQSFWKDIVLLVLILIIFFNKKYLTPLFQPAKSHKWIVFAVLIACLAFAYYVLMHLPMMDFRAYKVGANIEEGMSVPENAPEAVYEYAWKFLVDGKEKIVTTTGAYPDVEGKFIEVNTQLIQEGYVPPVHDFAIIKDGEDLTQQFLNEEKLIVVTAYNLSKSVKEGWPAIKKAAEKAQEKGYTVIALSASAGEEVAQMKATHDLNFEFYLTDATTIKTIVRSNPGLVKLSNGTILQKLHWNDAEKLKLE